MPVSKRTREEARKQHHREACRARIAAKRRDRKGQGLCPECGGPKGDGSSQKCDDCKRMKRERDADYIRRGVCRNCGAEKEEKSVQHCNKCRLAMRVSKLRNKYHLTTADYDRMFAEQGGVCWICKQREVMWGNTLHIDHDERTGKVRGLLCGNCNRAIGLVHHSPEILRRAIEYLEVFGE